MRVLGIGNLILDYYFFNDNIYINGGGTVSNILVNLSSFNVETKIIGYYGNDVVGHTSKNFIEKAGVNTSLLEEKNYSTKCFFINNKETNSICPYCRKKRKNYKLKDNFYTYINKDDIILIQDYTVLKDIPNKICLDFSYFNKLIYKDNNDIKKYIFRKK